jgi:hypothetical protein
VDGKPADDSVLRVFPQPRTDENSNRSVTTNQCEKQAIQLTASPTR